MKISQELKILQKKWKKSKAKNILKPVPDGNYSVRVVDSRLEKAKSSDRLQIAQIMQIQKGKYKDRMLYRYDGLETEENIGYIKGMLKRLEIKIPKKIVKLTSAIEKCIDLECEVTVRTKGEFTNVYINQLTDAIEEDEEDEIEEDEDEDEDEEDEEDEE